MLRLTSAWNGVDFAAVRIGDCAVDWNGVDCVAASCMAALLPLSATQAIDRAEAEQAAAHTAHGSSGSSVPVAAIAVPVIVAGE